MKKIPLTKDNFALVDDEDYIRLSKYKWCVSKSQCGNLTAVRRNGSTIIKMLCKAQQNSEG